jgi:hypothetical protein
VSKLDNYDELLRACGYFIYRYGRLDAVESLNEHWLLNDARLRKEFNLPGMSLDYVSEVKRKSRMKKYYAEAGVPFARYTLANGPTDLAAARAFAQTAGYPLIVKPDIGVGATTTFKLNNDGELAGFLSQELSETFILEEFIPGNIITFDALTDSRCQLLYATNHFLPVSLMDIVTQNSDVFYHSQKISPCLLDIGARTVKAFGIRQRFVHLEFFQLYEDKEPLGKRGDIVALEVNLRPGGAYIPDMINYAADIDVYQLWADMICYDRITAPPIPAKYFCGYVGRKFQTHYQHTHQDIMTRYKDAIVLTKEVEEIFVRAMGKFVYLFRADNMDTIKEIAAYIMT